jgi:hypothetical protein
MLEFILELLFSGFFDILLQVVVELLAEIGFHAISKNRANQPIPMREVLSAIVFAAVGGLLGWLSLFPLPNAFIRHPGLRLANAILAPLFAGILVAGLDAWRRGRVRGRSVAYFVRVFVFAFAFAGVRYLGAR